MAIPYRSIDELVEMIEEPNRQACERFLSENRGILEKARGSAKNHQAWEGGYLDHLREIMNYAVAKYGLDSSLRPLPFTLSDALLALFLHDIEKPWKYDRQGDLYVSKPSMDTKQKVYDFKLDKIEEYRFILTDAHRNAIQFAEGELGSYSQFQRQMGPLAAFVHQCDVYSARQHPDKGQSRSWDL